MNVLESRHGFDRTVALNQALPSALLILLLSDAISEHARQTENKRRSSVQFLEDLFGEPMTAASPSSRTSPSTSPMSPTVQKLIWVKFNTRAENVGLNHRLPKGTCSSRVDLLHVGFDDRTCFLPEPLSFLSMKSCSV